MELPFGLDSFRDDLHVKAVRQRDHGTDDGVALRALADVTDKTPVNFQFVDRQPLEITERRIARTEVVD